MTDYRAVLEEKHDRERMQFDETYARTVYRDLGGGDEALGARRFAEAIAADYADENAERIARSNTDVIAQSEFDNGGRERILRDERRALLETARQRIEGEIAALETAHPTPPSDE